MDEITVPLGLCLPSEARVWWGWHDGAPWRSGGELTPERFIGPGREYMPLRDAVDAYLSDRQSFEEIEDDPEPFRPAAYFPITRSSGPILCDCSVAKGAPSPIYYTHAYGQPAEELQRPAARSFGEMVGWWIDALNDGAWQWDSTSERWSYFPERLDPARELSGLV
ncbi:MAG TPA: hypothetical protein VEX36_09650 [Thermoleophilaceae bacterium]|nr:hypothetical protein [Thermoleophilaceae bacterium]